MLVGVLQFGLLNGSREDSNSGTLSLREKASIIMLEYDNE